MTRHESCLISPRRVPPGRGTKIAQRGPERTMEKIRIEQHSFGGLLWVAGWLFTIGFLHLTFWKGVAALFVWPVFLGWAFSPLLQVVARISQ